MNWAFDCIQSLKRKARLDARGFWDYVVMNEPLKLLEIQAAEAERIAIRRWNETFKQKASE